MNKARILFICTKNSARSQMAEGLVNSLFKDKYIAFSGGTNPSKVNPYEIKVMEEIGIDISNQKSKHFNEFYNQPFDMVVTVCDNAKKCALFFQVWEIWVINRLQTPQKLQVQKMMS